MPVNKVVFGNTTILDLTQSTLDNANKVLSGITAYDRAGNLITGSLVVQHYYTGSGEPSASLGADGDIYLEVVS